MASRSVSVDLTANPAGFIAGFARAGGAAEALDAKTAALSKNLRLLGGAFIAMEVVKGLVDATKAAGNFQAQITRLKTDANETAANLGMLSKGVVALSNATGTSTTDLNAGLYKIESAGIHGANALLVLKAAAEGAKVGFADMTTVSDALTTAMTDYNIPATGAVSVTNQLIAAVSRGKTDLESLSASLSTVAPVAHTAGISLDETLAAMSTMTAQGTPAAKAATYLAQTIKSIEAPTQKSTKELDAIGLSAADLSMHLGDRGLGNTLETIVAAIKHKMGPAGDVMLTNLQKLSGKTSDFQKILADVPPGVQSYVQALALGTGTTKTLQAVLELTGANAATFAKNTADISKSSKGAGKDVNDWAVVQKNFNQKLAEAETQFSNLGLALGQKVLPFATKFVGWLSDGAKWLTKYPKLVEGVTFSLLGAGGLILGLKLAAGAVSILTNAMSRSVALRTAMTGGLVAEGAAADKATASIAALSLAESKSIGLRTPLAGPGPLAGLGLAGAATTGGETAAIGGMSATALGAAIAAPIVLALGATFVAYKLDQRQSPSSYKGAIAPGAGYVPGMGAIPGSVPNQKEIGEALAKYATSQGQNTTVKFTGDDRESRTLSAGRFKGIITGLVGEGKAAALTAEQVDQLVQAQNKVGPATTLMTKMIQQQTAAFTVLNVAGQNAVVANENYQASIAGLKQSVKDNGTSLDETTAKGRANTDAMVAQAGAINEVDTAYFSAQEKTKGYKTALSEVTTKLQGQKQALIDQATRLGISHAAAKKLVDQILLTPKQVTTTFNSPQLTAMSKKVADLQNQINQLTGKPYYITVGIDTKGSLQSTINQQVPHAAQGHNATSGYVAGMTAGVPHVKSAAHAMAKAASDTVATFNEAQSPSKLYHRHGYNAATGLHHGLHHGKKGAASAGKALASAAVTALRTEIKDGITLTDRVLQASISALSKKLTSAQSRLSTLRGDRTSAEQAAKGVFTSSGDLSNITGAVTKGYTNWDGTVIPDSTAPVTAVTLNAGLAAIAAKDQQFISKLKRLQKMGLTHATWVSILNMGPDAGMPYVDAILSGGQSEVNTVNTLEGGISQSGNIAASAAGSSYNGAIDRQVKAVDKLTRELADLKKELRESKNFSLTLNLDKSVAELKRDLAEFERRTGIKLDLKTRTG